MATIVSEQQICPSCGVLQVPESSRMSPIVLGGAMLFLYLLGPTVPIVAWWTSRDKCRHCHTEWRPDMSTGLKTAAVVLTVLAGMMWSTIAGKDRKSESDTTTVGGAASDGSAAGKDRGRAEAELAVVKARNTMSASCGYRGSRDVYYTKVAGYEVVSFSGFATYAISGDGVTAVNGVAAGCSPGLEYTRAISQTDIPGLRAWQESLQSGR